MGRIRSALRAYALVAGTPDEVLSLTNRKVQHFEVGQMATVAVAVLSPPYDRAAIALAGHPPPILAQPGRPAVVLPLKPGTPLGVNAAVPAASHHGGAPPGLGAALLHRRAHRATRGAPRRRTRTSPCRDDGRSAVGRLP